MNTSDSKRKQNFKLHQQQQNQNKVAKAKIIQAATKGTLKIRVFLALEVGCGCFDPLKQ